MNDRRPTSQRPPDLILASTSPRRRALLSEHGLVAEICAPTVDEPEKLREDLTPVELAEALAYYKAAGVAWTLDHGWVIGGDTVVAAGNQVFGKPHNRRHAADIIAALAGTNHDVISAVAIIDAQSGRRQIAHDRTTIVMRALSEQEIETYLDTGAWIGKAGAYGIQDYGDAFVTEIRGSFTNVVGMPMELLLSMFQKWGYNAAT
ncbi:MAG: Maf family protein [Phycisphaerae bacterium]